MTQAWKTKRAVAVKPRMKPMRKAGRGETTREVIPSRDLWILVLLLFTVFLGLCPFALLQLWATLLSVRNFWNGLALGLAFLLLLLPAAGWDEFGWV